MRKNNCKNPIRERYTAKEIARDLDLRELTGEADDLIKAYGDDAVDYLERTIEILENDEMPLDKLEQLHAPENTASTIQLFAHQNRENKRIAMLLDHCQRTGAPLMQLGAETTGMHPNQVREFLKEIK